ncbi:MAG: DUF1659 domain-containing protein [Clostridia bacterium]
MPVLSNPLDSRVQIKLNTGTDEDGKAIIKTKTINDIKSSAADQDVMDIVQGLSALQQHSVSGIIRIDEEELVDA